MLSLSTIEEQCRIGCLQQPNLKAFIAKLSSCNKVLLARIHVGDFVLRVNSNCFEWKAGLTVICVGTFEHDDHTFAFFRQVQLVCHPCVESLRILCQRIVVAVEVWGDRAILLK